MNGIHNKLKEVSKIVRKKIDKRIIEGTTTSIPINCGSKIGGFSGGNYNKNCFVMKLDANIPGLPDEIVVKFYSQIGFHIRPEDKVKVMGTFFQEELKFWNKDFIWIDAAHIFNETLGCGY